MKRIHYAGTAFLTGDRIADALLDYAVELARHSHADLVSTPTVVDDRIRRVALLLSPASQLLVEPVDDTRNDPPDDGLLRELARRRSALRGASDDPESSATSR